MELAEAWAQEGDVPRAAAQLREALAGAVAGALRFEAVVSVELAARLLAGAGEARLAVRLYAAADAARMVLGSPALPEEAGRRSAIDAVLDARLGESAQAERASGAGLDIVDAAREALAALAVFGESKPD